MDKRILLAETGRFYIGATHRTPNAKNLFFLTHLPTSQFNTVTAHNITTNGSNYVDLQQLGKITNAQEMLEIACSPEYRDNFVDLFGKLYVVTREYELQNYSYLGKVIRLIDPFEPILDKPIFNVISIDLYNTLRAAQDSIIKLG